MQGKSLEEVIQYAKKEKHSALLDSAVQHFNHCLYFKSLAPGPTAMVASLGEKLRDSFGSVDAFKKQFEEAAVSSSFMQCISRSVCPFPELCLCSLGLLWIADAARRPTIIAAAGRGWLPRVMMSRSLPLRTRGVHSAHQLVATLLLGNGWALCFAVFILPAAAGCCIICFCVHTRHTCAYM